MPDIQFDSLIILLLVLASLFGRLFKKKGDDATPTSPTPRQPSERPDADEVEEDAPELCDVLRDSGKKTGSLGNRNTNDINKA